VNYYDDGENSPGKGKEKGKNQELKEGNKRKKRKC